MNRNEYQVKETGLTEIVGEEQLNALKERFLSEQGVKPTSRQTYGYALSKYIKWMLKEGKNFEELEVKDILSFRESLEKENLTELTETLYLQTLKLFYQWVEDCKLGENIAHRLEVRSRSGKEFMKMHLNVEECRCLLESVYNDTDRNSFRNYCIVNLILHTGLRTIEVCRLDIADMEMRKGKRVLKVWGKGHNANDKDKIVVLTDEAYGPIEEYLSKRPNAKPRDPLFVTNGDCRSQQGGRMSARSIQMICKKHLRNIGLAGHEYSAHSLRHTTAVQILRHGGNLRDAQRVLRHQSQVTTEIYLKSIEKEDRLEQAAEPLLDGLFNIRNY